MPQEDIKIEKILSAAASLFAQYGIKKTTVEEIAQRAGIGKGTLYLYFKSKEEIFAAVMDRVGMLFLDRLETTIKGAESPSEKIGAMIRMRFAFIKEMLSDLHFSREALYELRDDIIRHQEKFMLRELEIVQGILEDGVRRGEFALEDPAATTGVLTDILWMLDHEWVIDNPRKDLELKVEALIRLALRGLKEK